MTVRPAALLLVVFIASSPGVSFAQQADPGATPVASDAATADQNANAPASREEFPDETLFLKTLPYDIAGADYYSLVAWLRSLGLSDTGGVEELRSRLYAHYGVNAPAAAKTGGRVIVIESASSSRYVPGEGGDAGVTLSGGVVLTIVDDAAGESIRLEADSVRINRDASLLSARGRVRFERKKADGTEFFRGELLELDLNDRSGLFKEGQSEKGSGDDRLVFRADDITSKGGGVLVLSDGTISSCDEDYPHYSIRASKIWILGGNEWAMLDATLSVGELPVLWLPFFFYPGEEIVFHPVFGYDSRLGRFVQTTTYFLGEKPSKEESLSLFKLAGGAQSEKREVRGFFLRGTGQKKTGASDDFVKLFVDLYTNIGSFVGVNAKLNKLGPVTAFNAFAGLAVSR
mgnify:CR=1 FL=1